MSAQPPGLAKALKRRRTAERKRIRDLLAMLRPEDRRKVAYIEGELMKDRDPLDHELLRKTREDILRRYAKPAVAGSWS